MKSFHKGQRVKCSLNEQYGTILGPGGFNHKGQPLWLTVMGDSTEHNYWEGFLESDEPPRIDYTKQAKEDHDYYQAITETQP